MAMPAFAILRCSLLLEGALLPLRFLRGRCTPGNLSPGDDLGGELVVVVDPYGVAVRARYFALRIKWHFDVRLHADQPRGSWSSSLRQPQAAVERARIERYGIVDAVVEEARLVFELPHEVRRRVPKVAAAISGAIRACRACAGGS